MSFLDRAQAKIKEWTGAGRGSERGDDPYGGGQTEAQFWRRLAASLEQDLGAPQPVPAPAEADVSVPAPAKEAVLPEPPRTIRIVRISTPTRTPVFKECDPYTPISDVVQRHCLGSGDMQTRERESFTTRMAQMNIRWLGQLTALKPTQIFNDKYSRTTARETALDDVLRRFECSKGTNIGKFSVLIAGGTSDPVVFAEDQEAALAAMESVYGPDQKKLQASTDPVASAQESHPFAGYVRIRLDKEFTQAHAVPAGMSLKQAQEALNASVSLRDAWSVAIVKIASSRVQDVGDSQEVATPGFSIVLTPEGRKAKIGGRVLVNGALQKYIAVRLQQNGALDKALKEIAPPALDIGN